MCIITPFATCGLQLRIFKLTPLTCSEFFQVEFHTNNETACSLCQEWSSETDWSNSNTHNSQDSDTGPLEGAGAKISLGNLPLA